MSLSGFTTPLWFCLLVVVAALVAGYFWMQRRRRRYTWRFANLATLERVAPAGPGWRRHLPIALLLVALVFLTVGLSGPTAEQKVPRNRATVMLVIDVSLSMRANDIKPSRFVAAKRSAKRFTRNLPEGINLGLVSFAGSPTVLVSPTTERAPVREAINSLQLAEATGTGLAIFAALQAIESFGRIVGGAKKPPPARIVLLTDGKQTVPTANLNGPRGAFTAARAAAQAGVPISTISFGTPYGTVEIQGREIRVPAEDGAMRRIAQISGGNFYDAGSAGRLDEVYESLAKQIGYEIKRTDASGSWFALGTVTAIIGVLASLLIGQRVL